MSHKLHVYSATCTWHGTIDKAGKLEVQSTPAPLLLAIAKAREASNLPQPPPMSLPCCPHCKSMLFQMEETRFWGMARGHEDKGHPGYVDLVKWIGDQDTCYKDPEEAAAAYFLATGKEVKLQ